MPHLRSSSLSGRRHRSREAHVRGESSSLRSSPGSAPARNSRWRPGRTSTMLRDGWRCGIDAAVASSSEGVGREGESRED